MNIDSCDWFASQDEDQLLAVQMNINRLCVNSLGYTVLKEKEKQDRVNENARMRKVKGYQIRMQREDARILREKLNREEEMKAELERIQREEEEEYYRCHEHGNEDEDDHRWYEEEEYYRQRMEDEREDTLEEERREEMEYLHFKMDLQEMRQGSIRFVQVFRPVPMTAALP